MPDDGVPLAGQQQQFRPHAGRQQGPMGPDRFADRHVGVLLTVHQQGRRAAPGRNRAAATARAAAQRRCAGSPYSVTDAAAIQGSVSAKKSDRSDMPAWLEPDANSCGQRVSATRARYPP